MNIPLFKKAHSYIDEFKTRHSLLLAQEHKQELLRGMCNVGAACGFIFLPAFTEMSVGLSFLCVNLSAVSIFIITFIGDRAWEKKTLSFADEMLSEMLKREFIHLWINNKDKLTAELNNEITQVIEAWKNKQLPNLNHLHYLMNQLQEHAQVNISSCTGVKQNQPTMHKYAKWL